MGRVPRPEVEPGPRRDLADALHALHHEAGWPSLRVLARRAGCSHTTVSAVLSSAKLPSWGVVEVVVEAMGGDPERIRGLWLAASEPTPGPGAAVRMAGRRDELARVRRHLAGGSGLLLVTGEAGIGKTRLVDTAVGMVTPEVFVARGACLPLSTQVPLLPVADVLRSAHVADRGQWVEESLAGCAPYVRASLAPLLPELGEEQSVPEQDAWWRQRLFASVQAILSGLAAVRPLAVVVEDLHWADAATLDVVEHLLTRELEVPVVVSCRTDDPDGLPDMRDRLQRVRRMPSVAVVDLGVLDVADTAEMVGLLGVRASDDQVGRIHRRSGGLPLYVEHLATRPDDDGLPGALADLLDRRLDGLDEDAWALVRTLGVADRPLSDGVLQAVTGLGGQPLVAGLRGLRERRLVVTDEQVVRPEHPLVAEAVRRRLVAGEGADTHRRLATALAASTDGAAGEIAEHWQQAGDVGRELDWRVRAAQEAGSRLALEVEAQHWLRVLAIWPEDRALAGSPPVTRLEAYRRAMDALDVTDWDAARVVAEEALSRVADRADVEAAEVYRRAAEIRGRQRDPAGGLELADAALHIFASQPPSLGHARTQNTRNILLLGLGRWAEARDAARRAADIASAVGDLTTYRLAIAQHSYRVAAAGDVDQAVADLRTAAELRSEEPDPHGMIFVAMGLTCVLSDAGADADHIVAAARPAFEAAAARVGHDAAAAAGLDVAFLDVDALSLIRSNVSHALWREGRVHEAAAQLDPFTAGPASPTHHWLHQERALLDALRGRTAEALARVDALATCHVVESGGRAAQACELAMVELWCGRPDTAHERLVALREIVDTTDPEPEVGTMLALAAQAAADVADASRTPEQERRRLLDELDTLASRARISPFAPHPFFVERAAFGAQWAAERARLAGRPEVEPWIHAAAAWDERARPFDAAYCRWRGAQAALSTGHGTAAGALLRRAARDARSHVPLQGAIMRTMGEAGL